MGPAQHPVEQFESPAAQFVHDHTALAGEQEQRRVNVDFPIWMIQSLDKEAKRLGVPRQSIIKVWVAERLEKKKA